MRGDLPIELRQRERIKPLREHADRKIADLGDVAAADFHLQRFRLELGAVAARTFLRRLVLPQEDADVLLVPLVLEIAQEGKIPL